MYVLVYPGKDYYSSQMFTNGINHLSQYWFSFVGPHVDELTLARG